MTYTPKQLKILQIIYVYQKEHGFSPTQEELAKKLGVASTTIHNHLKTLVNKEAISRCPKEVRSIEILDHNFFKGRNNQIDQTDQIYKYDIQWVLTIMKKLGTEKLTWDGKEVTIFFKHEPWGIMEFKRGTWSRETMETLQSKMENLPPFKLEKGDE